jgi:hypothetical protein
MKQKDILGVEMIVTAAALMLVGIIAVPVEAQSPGDSQTAEISDDDINTISNDIAVCCADEITQDISMTNSIEDNDVIGLDQNFVKDPEE